ncbi:unnamed protein product [Peniophora sp. CBMAI 1063]|nr:unnamed protein product [Peniophora sp. CBMAI 1063]
MFPTYANSSVYSEGAFFVSSAESVPFNYDRVDLTGLIGLGLQSLVKAGKRRVLGFMRKDLANPQAECSQSSSSPVTADNNVDDTAALTPSATFDPSPFVFGIAPPVVDIQCHRHDHPYCASMYASPRTFTAPPLYSEESISATTYEAPQGVGLGLFGVNVPSSNGSIVTEEELRVEERKRFAGVPGWFRRSSFGFNDVSGADMGMGDDDSAELERVRRWSSAWGLDLDD